MVFFFPQGTDADAAVTDPSHEGTAPSVGEGEHAADDVLDAPHGGTLLRRQDTKELSKSLADAMGSEEGGGGDVSESEAAGTSAGSDVATEVK